MPSLARFSYITIVSSQPIQFKPLNGSKFGPFGSVQPAHLFACFPDSEHQLNYRYFQDWTNDTNQLIYTIVCLLVQYLIPSLCVGIIYARISNTITKSHSHKFSKQIARRKIRRTNKTNRMLMMVSLVFFISWAPLNIFNLVLDIFSPFKVCLRIFILMSVNFPSIPRQAQHLIIT